jgi:hypothetical protein
MGGAKAGRRRTCTGRSPAVVALEEHGAHSGGLRGRNIDPAIPDEPGVRKIDAVLPRRSQEQPRFRLAAQACVIGVMHAGVRGVRPSGAAHADADREGIGQCHQASGDVWLIGHDHREELALLQASDRSASLGRDLQFLHPVWRSTARMGLVQDPIPIEKHCPAPSHHTGPVQAAPAVWRIRAMLTQTSATLSTACPTPALSHPRTSPALVVALPVRFTTMLGYGALRVGRWVPSHATGSVS